jgi:hypothetical protein
VSDTGSRVRPSGPGRSRGDDASDFWPADVDRRGGPSRKVLMIGGAAAVAVLVVVVAAVVLMGGGSSGKGTTSGGTTTQSPPTVYVPSTATQGTKKLNNRSADSRALNDGEVFDDTATKVTHGQYTFNLVAKQISGDCQSVAWGSTVLADLKTFGCTQVVRGAYLSTDKEHSGQFIAVNMEKLAGSEAVVRDLAPAPGSGFIKPLPGAGIDNFGAGFSAAYPQIFGHYVVISWVQRNGGAKPASMNELLDASLAIESADGFIWERLLLAGG